MNFAAILFDCDGVLVDSEVIYVEVERDHLSRIGLHYDLEDYQSRFNGLTSADFGALLHQEYEALGKGPIPADFFDNLDAATKERMDRDLTAIDGIIPLLNAYDGPLAVASSSRLFQLNNKLRQTGLHDYFDPYIYSGEQVANGKPAPDLFLFAAENLSVEPERCVVIEDSVNGVRAGCAAGMAVWGFTGGSHANDALGNRLAAAGAEKVFASHAELAGHLSET